MWAKGKMICVPIIIVLLSAGWSFFSGRFLCASVFASYGSIRCEWYIGESSDTQISIKTLPITFQWLIELIYLCMKAPKGINVTCRWGVLNIIIEYYRRNSGLCTLSVSLSLSFLPSSCLLASIGIAILFVASLMRWCGKALKMLLIRHSLRFTRFWSVHPFHSKATWCLSPTSTYLSECLCMCVCLCAVCKLQTQ